MFLNWLTGGKSNKKIKCLLKSIDRLNTKIKSKNTGNSIRIGRKCLHTTTEASCVLALYGDLSNFETTSKIPEKLGSCVVSSTKAQAHWYRKILEEWKQIKPQPTTGLEASKVVIAALKNHRKLDVEGLLFFYGLPSIPKRRVMFEIETLPVDTKSVAVGNTIIVYAHSEDVLPSVPKVVSDAISKDMLSLVPKVVSDAVVKRAKALADKRYFDANTHNKMIKYHGFRVISFENEEVVSMKFVIRLSGIDAPKSKMQYGKESRDELRKIVEGKSLKVLVYTKDLYRRCVGDVYCNGEFVQETMLKKGMAWHYVAYDKRAELAKWENEAREKGIGLWASSNPEEPWEWRKKRRG